MIWTIIGSAIIGGALGIAIIMLVLKIKEKILIKKADQTQINLMEVKNDRTKPKGNEGRRNEEENNGIRELHPNNDYQTTTKENTSRQRRDELSIISNLLRD